MNITPEEPRCSIAAGGLRPARTFSQPVTFRYEIQNHTTRMEKLTRAFKVYRLVATTLICVIAGLIIGLVTRPYTRNWNERQFMYIELPGELYLRLLKLIIVPLLVSNVVLSFGTIQGKITSQLGKVAGFLYLGSNILAITIAIVVVVVFRPGKAYQTDNPLKPENLRSISNHHYFKEYHDSIIRYREYHPMFYHTEHDPDDEMSVFAAGNKTNLQEENRITSELEGQSRRENQTLLNLILPEDFLDYEQSEDTRGDEESPWPDDPDETYVETNQKGDEDDDRSSASNQINQVGLSFKLPIDVVLDVMRNLIPESVVGATLQQTRTRLFAPKELVVNKNGTTQPRPDSWPMGHEMISQANIIGLLAISVSVGIILSQMEEGAKPLLDLCACVSELSLRIGMKAINIAPVCIMFLLVGQIARSRDLTSMAGELLMYSTTVLVALFIHGFVLLPLIYYTTTKKSPFCFFMGMFEALVASFATSSSSATMPLTLNCLNELNLNMVIVRAFGPLGSVFNMNGTAIYEAIAVIFIAQTQGVTLPLTSLLLVGFSSAIASLSTSGIPSSGMMTMVIVLNAINIPVLQLSFIYIVDFIIDRFRTVVNVWSGALICGLINHICPEHLFEEEMKPEKYREMLKYRSSRGSLGNRKSLGVEETPKPRIISVTITPPDANSSSNRKNLTGQTSKM